MKPYRFITSETLAALSQKLNHHVAQWNEEYSLNPLHLELSLPKKNALSSFTKLIHAENKTLACSDDHLLAFMQQILFGQLDACFTETCKTLTSSFLGCLLGTAVCFKENTFFNPAEWVYPGSTCLQMTLHSGLHCSTLLLSPAWVYQELPPVKKKNAPVSSLDDALKSMPLSLTLELETLHVPLHQLLGLQPGDVLVSDHCLESPLALIHDKKRIARATPGQVAHLKSINIEELS